APGAVIRGLVIGKRTVLVLVVAGDKNAKRNLGLLAQVDQNIGGIFFAASGSGACAVVVVRVGGVASDITRAGQDGIAGSSGLRCRGEERRRWAGRGRGTGCVTRSAGRGCGR